MTDDRASHRAKLETTKPTQVTKDLLRKALRDGLDARNRCRALITDPYQNAIFMADYTMKMMTTLLSETLLGGVANNVPVMETKQLVKDMFHEIEGNAIQVVIAAMLEAQAKANSNV